MLRAIERSHAAIVLGPDADIFEFAVGAPASLQDFFDVPPIHALEADPTIAGKFRKVRKNGCQDRCKRTPSAPRAALVHELLQQHALVIENAPMSRAAEATGRILCRPILGGLHHH
jgi:hypothetical protein